MSETLQTMANRIIKEVKRNDIVAGDVFDYIFDAIKFYRNDPFFKGEGYYNFTTTPFPNPGPSNFVFPDPRSAYRLPNDYIETLEVTVLFDGTALPLNLRSLDWFVEQCEGNPVVTGPPTDFILYDDQIYFWPMADQQYQATLWYKKAVPAPSVNAPTEVGNFWMTSDREPMVRAMAKSLLFAQRIRDQANAGVCKNIADAFFQKLQSSVYGNLFTGSPRDHQW